MTPIHMYQELSFSIQELNARGLFQAAKWAAEQLTGLDEEVQQQGLNDATSMSHVRPPHSMDQHPHYLLGRSHFEFKEYQRAAYVLTGVPGVHAQFLRLYAVFLAGEKRKEQERVEKAGPLGKPDKSMDSDLDDLEGCLAEACRDCPVEEPFLQYLHGVVLLDKKRNQEAQDLLLRSLHAFPCNWSAWQALRPLCTSLAALESLQLPNHWTRDFFLASVLLDLQQNQEALGRLQRLSHMFPQSVYMESLVAQAHYNLQNYDEAQSLFEDILSKDPFRLEGMDVFSNILFVKEQFAALSQLAHRAVATDKYSPETCCIVGNYYSLKGQHEKAVEYFRRALRLNCSYLAAWTLMGHEFMEMKNTPAAIEAYRRAVDLNPHDFRAWYGLGQAYELLKMPFYAVYYYRRATALRPQDARMWCALGQCYVSDQVNLQDQAVRCYRRAIEYNDPDGIAAHMLAKLYEARNEFAAAEQLYRYNLARLDAAGQPLGADAVDALLFLASYCKDTGRLAEAQACCERLLDVGGPAKEKAKAMAREVHALLTQQEQLGRASHLREPYFQPHPQRPATGRPGSMPMQLSFLNQEADEEVADMEACGMTPEHTGTASEAGPSSSRGTGMPAYRAAGPQPGSTPGGGVGAMGGRPGATPSRAGLAYDQRGPAFGSPAEGLGRGASQQDADVVAAVMEQLRVPRHQALELLAQAGSDPVRAIQQNSHMLE